MRGRPLSSHNPPRRFGGRSSATPSSIASCACAGRQSGSALRVRSSPRSPRRLRGEKTRLRTACAVTTARTRILMSSSLDLDLARINAQSDSLGFDAAWEIDLFGHVRRSVEAARADLGAERANYQDAQVTVAAEVARNYFELRGAQRASGGGARKLEHRTSNARTHATAGRDRPWLGARRAAQSCAPEGHRGHDSTARGGGEADRPTVWQFF